MATQALLCPTCGGTVEIRGMQHTRSVVCVQCLSVLDTTTPSLQLIQRFEERVRVQPLIPMGTRGKLHGSAWESIGFQVRTITVDGVEYSWHEYLLFNPYKGFRYLTQYGGHWNDVIAAKGLPTFTTVQGRKAAVYAGTTFRHFQNAEAETTFVMGEFPWRVRVGDKAVCDDYVAPPEMLSSEMSEGEITWSVGNYVEGVEVWRAFALPGAPPPKTGVFANQPSPHAGKVAQAWQRFVLLALLWAVVVAFFTFSAQNREAYKGSFRYAQNSPGEHSLVTPIFELGGRTTNVEVELSTDLSNNWAYFNLALINEKTGQGYDFGREVSYYTGRDSDGAWSEGRARDRVTLPRIPPGRYYLRVEPEMDAEASARAAAGMSMNYDLTVRRDVPSSFWLWLALPLLVIPPVVTSIRAGSFEGQRWMESDYAAGSGAAEEEEE
jgi:hypothetical protein